MRIVRDGDDCTLVVGEIEVDIIVDRMYGESGRETVIRAIEAAIEKAWMYDGLCE